MHNSVPLSTSCRLDEVKGLLEFLAYEPFYRSAAWRGLVQGEFSERGVAGLLSMRALLRGVMLRRSKADVGECDGRVRHGSAVCVAT